MMIDTGATPNCIILRCVSASDILKELPRKLYHGSNIIDANGQPLRPEFTIQCNLTMGTPKFSINCVFLVLEALPFSCILGQNTFSKFSSWNISNLNKIITINNETKLPYFSSPSSVECLQLITTNKVCLNSYKSTFVEGRITGSALSAFRPVTHVPVVIEGNNELTNRLLIKVIPAVCILTHQNCTQKVMIYNNSSQQTILAKGTKLAHCYDNFEEYFLEPLFLSCQSTLDRTLLIYYVLK